MDLTTKTLSLADAKSILVGQAVMTKQSGEVVQIGEIYKNGQMFELSLFLMPTSGCVELWFENDVQQGPRDLTAVIFGRHDTYEYTIGSVELTGSKGTAIIDAVPCRSQYRAQMLF